MIAREALQQLIQEWRDKSAECYRWADECAAWDGANRHELRNRAGVYKECADRLALLADVLGSPRPEKDQEGDLATRVDEHTVIPPERATAATDTAIRALWERVGVAADSADNFYNGPRIQPRLEADCLRHGMHQLRDELRAIVIEATGENPWNSESEKA